MERSHALVDALLTEYLQEQDEGRKPNSEEYLRRLPSEVQRREFQERLKCLHWAMPVLPTAITSRTVLADRYELMEEIGSGGFGKVWRALDHQLQREVAVKVLNVMASAHANLERYHRSEWRALSRLQHPGVVRIHAAADHEGTPFLVMDLVRGRSLDDVLDDLQGNGAPPDPETFRRLLGLPCPAGVPDLIGGTWGSTVARIMVEVLRILEAAHAAGVLHRDIKPGNLMLTGGAHPVLLDFGMASLTDESTGLLTGRLVGTANYLAPEQIRVHAIGRSVLTDVYQTGLLLYEMLTLRPAFSPQEGVSTIPDRILHGEFARPREVVPDVPEEIEAICIRALQHTPERRFASATSFREALEQWLADGRLLPGVAVERTREDEPLADDRYRVIQELLRNEFEVVQLAWDRLLEREVLLKRAGPGLWSPHVRKRVKREAQSLIRVDHPGVARLHDVTHIGDDLVLVMAPLRGAPIAETLNQPLTVPEAIGLGIALADALHSLHKVGIVHCCVGPETMWIDENGRPMVSGFTFARDLDGSTVSTIGFDRTRPEAPAQAYMAPEQQAGHRPDARADVFALGCLLYRCLTGSDPVSGTGKAPDARSVRRDVPRALAKVLGRCMHPARTQRFSTMTELTEALRQLA